MNVRLIPSRLKSNHFLVPALLACALTLHSTSAEPATKPIEVPAVYRSTREQAGHEFVKTEQFIVALGTPVSITGLEFARGESKLSDKQKRIVQQIFNSLEEITENTVSDPDEARVAEFKKMKFEIRGDSDLSGDRIKDAALGEARARNVMDFLTNLGTPAWRLKARAADSVARGRGADPGHSPRKACVEFIRTR